MAQDNLYDLVSVKRSGRITVGIEIRPDESILVRAPYSMSDKKIREFVGKHKIWIEKHLEKVKKANAAAEESGKLTAEELRALAEKAAEVIPQRVSYYAPRVGVSYGKITIRMQKTIWGSCTAKGNLSFNCLIMLAPPEVIDSVVVHELCHIKQMNHSPKFYDEVLRVFPKYYECRKWLRDNGSVILKRNTEI